MDERLGVGTNEAICSRKKRLPNERHVIVGKRLKLVEMPFYCDIYNIGYVGFAVSQESDLAIVAPRFQIAAKHVVLTYFVARQLEDRGHFGR